MFNSFTFFSKNYEKVKILRDLGKDFYPKHILQQLYIIKFILLIFR